MTNLTPDELDQWRAKAADEAFPYSSAAAAFGEYRRLVRENVLPPEPVDELEECVAIAIPASQTKAVPAITRNLRQAFASRGLAVRKVVRMTPPALIEKADTIFAMDGLSTRDLIRMAVQAGFLAAGGEIIPDAEEGR